MAAYYNENDPYCAQWLRNLIAACQIAPGDVDERSIEEVRADDLRGYTQCHFFAGIGAWSYALGAAGWENSIKVWTGSCPCQPFSSAGYGKGFDDSRHLWPDWARLIQECRPNILFGEQVSSPDALAWLDVVLSNLESYGYACAPLVTTAAGIGANHIRPRAYFVADSDRERLSLWYERTLIKPAEIARAWSQFERVHAERAWKKWDDESDLRLLTPGSAIGMAQLRALGNSLCAYQAAEFVRAYMECER